MSATKWPFSASHQFPDEPCAGRCATRPRVVRRIAEDVVWLFLLRILDFAPCGSVLSAMPVDAPECLPWYGATCGSVYTIVALCKNRQKIGQVKDHNGFFIRDTSAGHHAEAPGSIAAGPQFPIMLFVAKGFFQRPGAGRCQPWRFPPVFCTSRGIVSSE